jgi:tetratricopeptide (TPR) repeat protein
LIGLTCWNGTRSAGLSEALAAEDRGDFTTALRNALEHLDRRPWSRDADRVAARCLSRLDRAEQAEPYYKWARTHSIEDLHYRAYGLVRANLRDRAIDAYEDILAREPADVSALRLEAGVLLSQSRFDDVKAVGRRLTEISGGPVTVYTPVPGAGSWTLKTSEVASPAVIGYTLLGVASHDLRESEEAVAAFDRVLQLDPDLRSMPLHQPLFWSNFAEDLLKVGRLSDVVHHLTRALQDWKDPGLMNLLGEAHRAEAHPEKAERCWRQALEWDPNSFYAWLHLGRLKLERGRPEEAIDLLKHAEQLGPDSHDSAYSLSRAYFRIGQDAEGRKYQEKAGRLRALAKGAAQGMGDLPSPSQTSEKPSQP